MCHRLHPASKQASGCYKEDVDLLLLNRMSALPASSQTVVTYLGYLLESVSISAKSLQPYLSVINVVHNDFEYPPPACGHLVKLARKGFAELQVSTFELRSRIAF